MIRMVPKMLLGWSQIKHSSKWHHQCQLHTMRAKWVGWWMQSLLVAEAMWKGVLLTYMYIVCHWFMYWHPSRLDIFPLFTWHWSLLKIHFTIMTLTVKSITKLSGMTLWWWSNGQFHMQSLLPAKKEILLVVQVMKVKCILRSKVLLLLLVLLVKARSGCKQWSKTSKWGKTQYYCYIWQCISLWALWGILGYVRHNTLYIICLFK